MYNQHGWQEVTGFLFAAIVLLGGLFCVTGTVWGGAVGAKAIHGTIGGGVIGLVVSLTYGWIGGHQRTQLGRRSIGAAAAMFVGYPLIILMAIGFIIGFIRFIA